MIRSMTGYGRCQECIDGRDILFEIKAVNHRYSEISIRTPRAYAYLEEKIKTYLQGKISRGKIDVFLAIQSVDTSDVQVEINHALAASYANALRNLSDDLNLKDDLSLSSISRFSDIFVIRKVSEDEEAMWATVQKAADIAVNGFIKMREVEGGRMKEDIISRLEFILGAVSKIEEQSPKTVEEYRNKLYAKMTEILGSTKLDDQRILTEAAIFAEKVAVDEETVRLKSHIHQFKTLLNSGEPVGRKLDFLVQEINRETNTIGSKASDIEVAKIVVDIKSELEKIREQIQNIE